MEDNKSFEMTYSAEQQEEIRTIREKYLPPKEDKMQQLRALDAAAERKASIGAIILGVFGTLVMGAGMSIIMTDFGAALGGFALPLGVVVGVAGLVLLAAAYPLYNKTLKNERERIAPEILKLTDELMQ